MATIAEQLAEIKRIKEAVKSKLEELSLIDANTSFSEYPSKIESYKGSQLNELEMFFAKDFGAFYENKDITRIEDAAYTFNHSVSKTSFSFPNLEYIGSSAFNYSAMTSLSIPSCKTIFNGLQVCQNLSYLYAPKVEYISRASISYTQLEVLDFPSLKTIEQGSFLSNKNVKKIWLPKSCTSITGSPFIGCQSGGDVPTIYCEVSSQPSGWSSTFARVNSSTGKSAVVKWGVTREKFEELL